MRALIVVLMLGCLAGSARGVEGFDYLENQSDHSGTLVEMWGQVTGIRYKAMTDETGYYSNPFVIPGATLDVLGSHGGYELVQLFDVWIGFLPPYAIPTVTLSSPCGWTTAGYPHQIPGSTITIPDDEGRHPLLNFPIEWWYMNAHLEDASGNKYAVWTSFFKRPQVRLFAISDLNEDRYYTHETPGLLLASNNCLSLNFTRALPPGNEQFKNKRYQGELVPFVYEIDVGDGLLMDMGLNLHMSSLKPPMAVGGDGVVEIGSGYSYYYSHTRLGVEGTLKIPDEDNRAVTGFAWIDHQWGNFGVTQLELVTWEWFAIQLDDPDWREITVGDLWVNGDHQGSFSGGFNLYYEDGTLEVLEDYTITPIRFYLDHQSLRLFATQWLIEESSRDVNLIVSAEFPEQVFHVTPCVILPAAFWEGVCSVTGTIGGQPVTGKAFAELTHSWFIDSPELAGASVNSLEANPENFALRQAYPNPFNPSTTIAFDLPEASHVKLAVFDLQGRLVTELVNGQRSAGVHKVAFDGSSLASGVYIYRLQAGTFLATGKMVLMK